MDSELNSKVFSKATVEFVTVAVQYCNYLESFEEISKDELLDKLSKFLPLLYLKAVVLPTTEMLEEVEPEMVVTEESYNYILNKTYHILGTDDTYLEVFLEDMKYSETPISASISENIADIYQDIKNFIGVYECGIEENMNDALFICTENFRNYWGQKLVNVLRAIHSLKYSPQEEEFEENINDENWW